MRVTIAGGCGVVAEIAVVGVADISCVLLQRQAAKTSLKVTREGRLWRHPTDQLVSALLLDLLEIALFDPSHHVFSAQKIILQLSCDLLRHHKELVVNHFSPDYRAPRGNQMRSPLKHQAQIPRHKKRQNDRRSWTRSPARVKPARALF